ncbi:MAG: DUF2089 domain-containing protein [Exilispira sp.]
MKKMIGRCPVCRESMIVTSLLCKKCNLTISGEFELDDFFKLTSDQLLFVKTFIRNRGNIKEVEKELGISYPTVRNKLDEIIEALGYKVEGKDYFQNRRKEILARLEKGEITSEQAIALLKEIEY